MEVLGMARIHKQLRTMTGVGETTTAVAAGGSDGVWKVVFKKKLEACGRETFRCPFCPEWTDDEKGVVDHVEREHFRTELRCYKVSKRTSKMGKKFHKEFSRWSDTTTTDYEIWDWLREARSSTRIKEEIVVAVVSIECRTLALQLYYCTQCGYESHGSLSQKNHFRDAHLRFIVQESRSRYFNC